MRRESFPSVYYIQPSQQRHDKPLGRVDSAALIRRVSCNRSFRCIDDLRCLWMRFYSLFPCQRGTRRAPLPSSLFLDGRSAAALLRILDVQIVIGGRASARLLQPLCRRWWLPILQLQRLVEGGLCRAHGARGPGLGFQHLGDVPAPSHQYLSIGLTKRK
jgi:hypothetical protein